jgi:hopanoid-associated phosphorylase
VTVVAVTGMIREARIVGGAGIKTIVGGGRSDLLRARLDAVLGDNPRGVISIGIAGGLSPALKTGDCVVASRIVAGNESIPTDTAWSESLMRALPDAVLAVLAGASAIVRTQEAKAALHRATGAYAVDMESHVAARFAADRGIAFAALRIVSDDASRTLPPAVLSALKPDGGVALGSVLRSLAANPAQIPALMQAGRDSGRAFAALLRCRNRLGSGFACPYLG